MSIEKFKNWESELVQKCENRRLDIISSLKNKSDVLAWQAELKNWFRKSVGPLVELKKQKKELKGTLDFGSIKIEKWIYEVFEGTYASALFYVPPKINPDGLIMLASIGHWKEGKQTEDFQNLGWFMALHGIPVLVYEHAGLGERREFWDPAQNKDMLGKSPTCEHCRMGDLAILAGYQASNYFLSEIRQSLNFLYSFDFVKKGKVGITGASGGGSMSREAACYFDELAFSIPVSIIRGESVVMSGCHEQLTWGEGYQGVATVDYLLGNLPKPAMIVSELINDGSEKSFARLKELYKKANAPASSYEYFAIKDVHGYTHPMIEAVYRFLGKNFKLPKLDGNLWQQVRILGKEILITKNGILNREMIQVSMAQQITKRIRKTPKGLNSKILNQLLMIDTLTNIPEIQTEIKIKELVVVGGVDSNSIKPIEWPGQEPGYYHGYGHVFSNEEPSRGRWFLSYGSTLIGFWAKQLLDYAEKNKINSWQAEGKWALPLLIAAVLGGKKKFPKIEISLLLNSYAALLKADLNLVECGSYIPGILNYGDIDDLIKLVEGKCVVKTRIDAFGRVIS
jgi:hypothetical protein